MSFQRIAVALGATACVIAGALSARAGTTGEIQGNVLESSSNAPIADASVTAAAPSQTISTTTNASGHFLFISLAPDTYTVSASKNGYNVASVPGVTVVSDQARTIAIVMQRTIKTLTSVTVRGESLVRPGTTSNVFSINSAAQKATNALGGSGGLNQAYGAIASAPGVVYQQGQQGWYQNVYIRGGDNDQTAYELDGIPVMRVSDSAPVSTLTNLGQAEVQVYTGGTPASAEASGIAGYVNQVIRTGTYPGFGTIELGMGTPSLFNKAVEEVGGATPNRLFSYYFGFANASQTFRYGDQNNGVTNPLFFFPLVIPSNNGTVFDGSGTAIFAPGQTYAQAYTTDQESIVNLHFGIPHHFDSGKDDIQALYVYSNILQKFYSSQNDLGLNVPAALIAAYGSSPMTYLDIPVYSGTVFAAPDPTKTVTMLFPNSGTDRLPLAPIPLSEREGSQNGMALVKIQWQRNFDSKTYLRLFAASNYNWWFISGPVSANLTFGDQLPDYEVIGHNWTGTAQFSRQLDDKNLLNATASYFTGKLQTYSMGFFDGFMTNLVDAAGNCYDSSGAYSTCFGSASDPTAPPVNRGTACLPGGPTLPPCSSNLSPLMPASGPAVANGAQWLITENGQNAQVDNVRPDFIGLSLTDQWRPNDKTTINAGIRFESFKYTLQNLIAGYPARAFWFAAYNRENCFATGLTGPVSTGIDPVTGLPLPCPAGTTHTNLVNYPGGTVTDNVFEPRLAFSEQVSQYTVIRGSYGRYARPAPTSYLEFNTIQQNLPAFIGSFLAFGYNSPFHETHADIANNYDLSLEQQIPHTDMAFKITPFLRQTTNQIQYLSLNAQGVVDGLNVGQQRSEGVEFTFTKGSFARDGWAAQLSATYTNSKIKFNNFPNGINLIDLLNTTVQQYNSYTSACVTGSTAMCGINGSTKAVACFDGSSAGAPDPTCSSALPIANPYFNNMPQPLFDRNGSYTTYDQIPAPFNNAIGFATPFQSSLVINYKRGRFNVTPSLLYSTQGKFGSPLVWPGYDPSSCTGVTGGTTADTTTCAGFLFIPDKYSGKFDNLGEFAQPQRLTANIAFGYDISAHVHATITVANLVDACFQHHYAWDSSTTCMYAQLPSNLLAPAGNFVANPPVQLAYPYGNWYNNIEIGQEGQRSPLQAAFEVQIKL
jgi:hypothetical protein